MKNRKKRSNLFTDKPSHCVYTPSKYLLGWNAFRNTAPPQVNVYACSVRTTLNLGVRLLRLVRRALRGG